MSTILLVGGIGRQEALYRDTAASLGHTLLYAETRLRGTPPHVDAVLIVTTTISHTLKAAAEDIARRCGAQITYLRQPSVSALRRALGELAAQPTRSEAP